MENEVSVYWLNPFSAAFDAVYILGYHFSVLLYKDHAAMIHVLASILGAAENGPQVTAFEVLNSVYDTLVASNDQLQTVLVHEAPHPVCAEANYLALRNQVSVVVCLVSLSYSGIALSIAEHWI